jgi:hypothetical protein
VEIGTMPVRNFAIRTVIKDLKEMARYATRIVQEFMASAVELGALRAVSA